MFLFLLDINLVAVAVCDKIERLASKKMTMPPFSKRLLYGIDSSCLK
jgi:hypothetical protein